MSKKEKSKINFENQLCNPNFIYLCGFLWGDGSLVETKKSGQKTVTCTINVDDYLSMKPIFDSTGKWNQFIYSRKMGANIKKYGRFYTSDKEFYDFLFKYGFKNKIGSHSQFLDSVKEEFHHFFWRGLIDADGHISIHQSGYYVIMCSAIDQDWSSLESYLKKIKISYKIILRLIKKGAFSNLIIPRLHQCKNFLDIIYNQHSNLCLPRKESKYKYIKDRVESKEFKRKPYGN